MACERDGGGATTPTRWRTANAELVADATDDDGAKALVAATSMAKANKRVETNFIISIELNCIVLRCNSLLRRYCWQG